MLEYVCFTMFSTFNLTPSATGMTGRDGRKTLGFYRLVRLVTSCPSLLVLKCKEIVLFHVLTWAFRQPLRSVVLVVTLLFLNRFLLSWGIFPFRLCCGTVSVCLLLLGEFLLVLSGTGMTSFCGCTEI